MEIHLLLLGIFIGAALRWGLHPFVRVFVDRHDRRRDKRKHQQACEVLARHGMRPALYLSTAGVPADSELYGALFLLEQDGRLILDQRGRLVGSVAPMPSAAVHRHRVPLKLVVSNEN